MEAAWKDEMEMLKENGVYEKVPIEECWEHAGKSPVGAK